MAYCFECGKKLPQRAVFCPNCGHTPPETQTTDDYKMFFCNRTDTLNTDDQAPPLVTPSLNRADSESGTSSIKKTGGKTSVIIACSIIFLLIVASIIITSFNDALFIGCWNSTSVNVGCGQVYPNLFGQNFRGFTAVQIKLNKEISLYSAYNNEIATGSWKETDNGFYAVIENEIISFVYDEGSDTLSLSGNYACSMVFKRTECRIEDLREVAESNKSTDIVAGSGEVGGGKYNLTVIGAEQFSNIDGKDSIRIYYNFTNKSDRSISARSALDFYAEQDSLPLLETLTWNEVEAYMNVKHVVRPGVTIQCCCEFTYAPEGGNLNLILFDRELGKEGGTVIASYLPGELPGAPAPYHVKLIDNPKWTRLFPSEGTTDGSFYLAVTKAELVDDSYNVPSVRIYYEFCNNVGKKTSLSNVAVALTFQDGVSLLSLDSETIKESDNNYYTEIESGKSISASRVFLLRNVTSPIEAELVTKNAKYTYGQTYTLS